MQTYFTTDDDFPKIISTFIPNIISIENIATGWTNFVFKVTSFDGSYIFRFPRNEFFSQALEKEVFVNNYLQKHLTFKINNLSLHKDHNRPFSIHPLVEGKSLTEEIEFLNKEELKQLAKDISLFIKELQAIDYTELNLDYLSVFLTKLSKVNKVDYYDLNILKDLQNIEDKSFFCHGDLNPGNIILKDHKLVAILDFAFASFSANIVDISRLIGRLPEKYQQLFLDEYEKTMNLKIKLEDINKIIKIFNYVEINYINYIKRCHKDIILPIIN